MKLFRNILVGVDLAQCEPLDVSGLSPCALEPIRWGTKLAEANAARLSFFSATNVTEENLLHLAADDRSQVAQALLEIGRDVLHEIAQGAAAKGITAEYKLAAGKGWLEIIRQVLQNQHDLVVVGTRAPTGLRRMLFGNTAMKLVRRCPCPVLVAKVGTGVSVPNILVTTDLKPVSEGVLRLGITLARQLNAKLHVLHVVEYKLDDVCATGLPDAKQSEYRRQVRAQAEQLLHAQLAKTEYQSLGKRIEIHLAGGVGRPDVAIQGFINTHQIDLLVMGTIGRGGIPGIMIGNTAERVLPEVHCSVLAVKPPDFVCPLTVEGVAPAAFLE